MLNTPMDVLRQFPVRKTKQQKQEFRTAVETYVTGLGYSCRVEEGKFGCRNMVIGDPEQAKYLVTAHYDTPARLLFPNSIAPCNRFLTTAKLILMILLFFCMGFAGGYLMGTGRYLPGIVLYSIPFAYILLSRLGPANRHNANDNTSGVVTVLEILRTLPAIHRDRVCFILFDLEEAGLIGSGAYRKAHKEATEKQIVLNLDCVGDGDTILFMPSKKLKQDQKAMQSLLRCGGWFGQKRILIRDKGYFRYPSDHAQFPLSVGIGAFHQKKGVGLYFSRIHTANDIMLDETNVNILRACIGTLIGMQ